MCVKGELMKKEKKLVTLILTLVMVLGLFGSVATGAKELPGTTPANPVIKLKKVNNGTSIKVNISATKYAAGYEVYFRYTKSNSLYSGYGTARESVNIQKPMTDEDKKYYKEEPESYRPKYVYSSVSDDDYKLYHTIEKDGTKSRSITISNLPVGTYSVKVRAYNIYGDSKYYSDYVEKSITLKMSSGAGEGYKKTYDFASLKKGDTFKFGAYEQDNNLTNGMEPIEWIVLSKTKSKMLVVSKYILDSGVAYNNTKNSWGEIQYSYWENSTLREWLNKKFYKTAFNKNEQKLIKTTKLDNYDNPYTKAKAGEDTKDKIFILSLIEATDKKYGFKEDYSVADPKRTVESTEYASVISSGFWYLRSQNSLVERNGAINLYDYDFSGWMYAGGYVGIRPAMVISL